MKITHKFEMDFFEKDGMPKFNAVQGDGNTRVVEVTLLAGGEAWQVPEGTSVSVAFRNLKDSHKGWYDKLPNGSDACAVDGNVVTATLAPAVLSGDGEVQVSIVFQNADLNRLATFSFLILVEKNPAAGASKHNDYYAYTTMEAVNEAMELLSSAIVCEAAGDVIAVADASDRLLKGLTLYGKTTQNGTPTPDAPVALVSAGDGGSIGVSITDGTEDNVQSISIHTPNGLPGIPVASGGNYTDSNGQQWICDEIDLARGMYVQRINYMLLNGTEAWSRNSGGAFMVIVTDKPAPCYSMCSSYAEATSNKAVGDGQYWGKDSFFGSSRFVFVNSAFSDVASWKANLASNPMELVYTLKTPIESVLDAETLAEYAALHSNKPSTTVLNAGGAGQRITYVADTKTYIDNKFKEVTNAIIAMGTI